MLQSCQIEMAV
ncbi:hypothetical protein F383_38606 [Gossypium arboreum]|uniref:Uncharacterized protein n=1 Tax=Gossypium arboreum TaxID=29729 RepID=A0A0B0MJR6_GOSAR|nr:hypothetical protein F383_38606 [Gossypium arboreum]